MSEPVRPARKDELKDVLRLVEQAGLPTQGVEEHFKDFLVAPAPSGLAGTVGLEVYESVALLRSLAVKEALRGKGLGTELVEAVLARARHRHVETLFLLTTTAEAYFRQFGFERIDREQIDGRLQASKELQGICPQTAVCMRKRLL